MAFKLGAEPKKLAAVAILVPIAAYLLYSNSTTDYSGPPSKSGAKKSAPGAKSVVPSIDIPRDAAVAAGAPRPNISRDRRRAGSGSQEWLPKIGGRRPEDQIDLSTIDPTLRVDLLARLQSVTIRGGTRSLFEVGTAPPPKELPPDKKIKPGDKKGGGGDGKLPEVSSSAAPAPVPESKPQAPPIPLKFYGFVQGRDGKRAFFLNGDDIFMASEGQTIQSRYKVIRIGLNTAVVEDTQHSNQQTIRLEEPPQGL